MKNLIFVLLLISTLTTTKIKAQIPTCPLKVGTNEVFSRNSPFGDKICPLLNTTKIITNGLGNNVAGKVSDVINDMNRFKDVTLDGAINTDAIARYNSSIIQLKSITTDLTSYLKDAECGVPGALDALKEKFLQSAKLINDLGDIALTFGDAFKKLGPVLPEIINIGNKTLELSASVVAQTPEMKNQFSKLTKAVEAIQQDLGKLLKNDPLKLINTGATIVTGVLPYLAECAACATTLSTSVAGLGTAATGAGVGTVTIETGAGALAGGAATIVGLVSSATSTALSSIPCKSVFDKSSQVLQYIKDVQAFTNEISNTATSIANSAEKIIEASDAIREIGKTLTQENKPKLADIQNSLVKISNTFSGVAVILQNTVVPKVNSLTGTKIKQITNDVIQLQECYDKLTTTFGYMTNNLKEGILDFLPAVGQIVDAEKVVNNLKNQLSNAQRNAETSVKNNWNNLDRKRESFISTILGPNPNDLGKVAAHMATLVTRIDELVKKGSELSNSVGDMVTDAVNAGKEGFLTDINTLKNSSQGMYTSISSKSKSLIITIAKEKARIEAIAKARELAMTNSKRITLQISSTTPIKPLSNAVQLKTKVM